VEYEIRHACFQANLLPPFSEALHSSLQRL
jgi:hypothetical protein